VGIISFDIRIFNYLEKKPIINIKVASSELGLAYNTVAKAVDRLQELNILYKPG
jgi:DNA-binding Lrp family transcriptional regulator